MLAIILVIKEEHKTVVDTAEHHLNMVGMILAGKDRVIMMMIKVLVLELLILE
jgi:hypothetical protein